MAGSTFVFFVMVAIGASVRVSAVCCLAAAVIVILVP